MTARSYELHGVRIFECSAEGPQLRSDLGAVDLISEARSQRATVIVIPTERLSDDFFRLKTGIAGGILQKFVTYGMRIAILGDISGHMAQSASLKAFVYESNRGSQCWFVENLEELGQRLEGEKARTGNSGEAAE
jgi:hypothetical protein